MRLAVAHTGLLAGARTIAAFPQMRHGVMACAIRGRKSKADAPVQETATPSSSEGLEAEAAPVKRRGRKPKAEMSVSEDEDGTLEAMQPPAAKPKPRKAKAEAPEESAEAVEAPATKVKKTRKPKATSDAVESNSSGTATPKAALGSLGIADVPWADKAAAPPEQQAADLAEYEASRGADTAERRKRKKKVPSVPVTVTRVTAELKDRVVRYDESG